MGIDTGISANSEIRFWRTPWRNDLFTSAIHTAEKIVAILKVVNDKSIVPEAADKHESISRCMSVDKPLIATLPDTSLEEVRDAILRQFKILEPLLSVFL